MVIFINNKGQAYPHIHDVGEDQVRLLTPDCIFKTLERDKFVEQMEGDAHDFLSSGLVTRMQVERYREKLLSMEAEAKELEERKATRETQEAWEEMTYKQVKKIISTAWKEASLAEQEELKLVFWNLGVDL